MKTVLAKLKNMGRGFVLCHVAPPLISQVGKIVDKRKNCQYCNNIFEYSDRGQKYCGRSCAAKFNNRARGTTKRCRRCETPCRTGRTFCSDICKAEYNTQIKDDKITGWLTGRIDACMKYTLAKWAREYVLEQAGYQCEAIDNRTGQRCTENRRRENGNTVLQVDHIDGNWINCVRENLRALCPTCHTLTPTWGAGNMGRGRTWKSQYNQYQKKH